jgi:hypothetical protein
MAAGFLMALYATSPNFGGRAADALTPPAGDFLQEWVGGYLIATGEGDRLYDADYFQSLQHDPDLVGVCWDKQVYFPPVYPPFHYFLVSPLGRIPFPWASVLWSAWLVTGLVAACWLLSGGIEAVVDLGGQPTVRGETLWPGLSRHALTGWLLLAAVLYPPVMESLSSSQKGTLLLFAYVLAYRLHITGHVWCAGLVFGLVGIKPQLAWLVPMVMLVRGEWRFVAGMAITITILIAGSLLVSRSAWIDYGHFLRGASAYARTPGYEYYLHRAPSLVGFWTLIAGAESRWTWWAVAITSGVAVVALLAVAWRTRSAGPQAHVRIFSAAMVATCLVSPHLFAYDLAILLLPTWLMVARWRPSLGGARGPLAGCAVLYGAACTASPIAQLTGIQIATLVLAGWLGLLLCRAVAVSATVGYRRTNGPQAS